MMPNLSEFTPLTLFVICSTPKTSISVASIKNASDLCVYLLSEALVALVTGDAFGDPNCIRISYAASEEILKKALSRVEVALLKLK